MLKLSVIYSLRNLLSFDSWKRLHIELHFCLYLSLLGCFIYIAKVSRFIYIIVLGSEITCLYTHSSELCIPCMIYLHFTFVLMEFCLGLSVPWMRMENAIFVSVAVTKYLEVLSTNCSL